MTNQERAVIAHSVFVVNVFDSLPPHHLFSKSHTRIMRRNQTAYDLRVNFMKHVLKLNC